MADLKRYLDGHMSPEEEREFRNLLGEDCPDPNLDKELEDYFNSMEDNDITLWLTVFSAIFLQRIHLSLRRMKTVTSCHISKAAVKPDVFSEKSENIYPDILKTALF